MDVERNGTWLELAGSADSIRVLILFSIAPTHRFFNFQSTKAMPSINLSMPVLDFLSNQSNLPVHSSLATYRALEDQLNSDDEAHDAPAAVPLSIGELADYVDSLANTQLIYQQAAFCLSDQCWVLVNSFNLWSKHLKTQLDKPVTYSSPMVEFKARSTNLFIQLETDMTSETLAKYAGHSLLSM